jgi:biotin operon repressor
LNGITGDTLGIAADTQGEVGMVQMRLGQVDLATGEILEGATLAVFYPKRKNGFTAGWVAMAQEPMMKLAQADLGKEAMRVLFAALSKLDFENWISLSHADLGRELNIKRPNISRAIARLTEEGVLLPGPKLHGRGTYTLNPNYGWKGSAKGHQTALLDRMKARGMSVVGEPLVDDRTLDLFGSQGAEDL